MDANTVSPGKVIGSCHECLMMLESPNAQVERMVTFYDEFHRKGNDVNIAAEVFVQKNDSKDKLFMLHAAAVIDGELDHWMNVGRVYHPSEAFLSETPDLDKIPQPKKLVFRAHKQLKTKCPHSPQNMQKRMKTHTCDGIMTVHFRFTAEAFAGPAGRPDSVCFSFKVAAEAQGIVGGSQIMTRAHWFDSHIFCPRDKCICGKVESASWFQLESLQEDSMHSIAGIRNEHLCNLRKLNERRLPTISDLTTLTEAGELSEHCDSHSDSSLSECSDSDCSSMSSTSALDDCDENERRDAKEPGVEDLMSLYFSMKKGQVPKDAKSANETWFFKVVETPKLDAPKPEASTHGRAEAHEYQNLMKEVLLDQADFGSLYSESVYSADEDAKDQQVTSPDETETFDINLAADESTDNSEISQPGPSGLATMVNVNNDRTEPTASCSQVENVQSSVNVSLDLNAHKTPEMNGTKHDELRSEIYESSKCLNDEVVVKRIERTENVVQESSITVVEPAIFDVKIEADPVVQNSVGEHTYDKQLALTLDAVDSRAEASPVPEKTVLEDICGEKIARGFQINIAPSKKLEIPAVAEVDGKPILKNNKEPFKLPDTVSLLPEANANELCEEEKDILSQKLKAAMRRDRTEIRAESSNQSHYEESSFISEDEDSAADIGASEPTFRHKSASKNKDGKNPAAFYSQEKQHQAAKPQPKRQPSSPSAATTVTRTTTTRKSAAAAVPSRSSSTKTYNATDNPGWHETEASRRRRLLSQAKQQQQPGTSQYHNRTPNINTSSRPPLSKSAVISRPRGADRNANASAQNNGPVGTKRPMARAQQPTCVSPAQQQPGEDCGSGVADKGKGKGKALAHVNEEEEEKEKEFRPWTEEEIAEAREKNMMLDEVW